LEGTSNECNKKSNKTLHAIRTIKNYFNSHELKIILNSYYYSVLYYYAEIWLTLTLRTGPKQQLISASANAIRTCLNYLSPYISFDSIHKEFKKSTPDQISSYKITLLLYNNCNGAVPGNDWVEFNLNIISKIRETTFDFHKLMNFKIGGNVLINKFANITRKIPVDHLNLGFTT
jgi:hypothetical protein